MISARALNELKIQVGRDYEEQRPNGVPPAPTTVTGSTRHAELPARARVPHEQRYEFMDSYTYYEGGHSLSVRRRREFVKELLINLFNGGGTYAYRRSLTGIANDCPIGSVGCTPAATGTTTGKHYTSYTQAFDLTGLNGKLNFNQWQQSFYAQDTWRVNNELLVNLGLRTITCAPGAGRCHDRWLHVQRGTSAYPLTTHFNQTRTTRTAYRFHLRFRRKARHGDPRGWGRSTA